MSDVTCVVFVPRRLSGELRRQLIGKLTGDLYWLERKRLGGSYFYLTGPFKAPTDCIQSEFNADDNTTFIGTQPCAPRAAEQTWDYHWR